MADKTGSVVVAPRAGEIGNTFVVLGKYTLDAALVTTDTYTIANLFPRERCRVLGVTVYTDAALDTNGTPTLSISVGNGDDADGFKAAKVSGYAAQEALKGDGALIGGNVKNPDVTLTVVANPATGATSGSIYIEALLERVGA